MSISRRSLLKSIMAIGAASGSGVSIGQSAEHNRAAPRTVAELKDAIESLFIPIGKSCRTWEQLGDHRVTFVTYVTGVRKEQGEDFPHSAFYPSEHIAVAATFNKLLEIKRNPYYDWSQEAIIDNKGDAPICASRVYWRTYPEIVNHKNGIFAVRFRAAFI